ncbi:DUF1294 domain-containing protein [Aquibacillus rhizosphaerae]|uniref:DUF1294 domain-containing protein n=1 Tax=Aquibacillus rhizosphaerae TaxID=3051431 RepID=A0ABT7L447_9BACI|nr:DUF1294 domain-containing protein [Aquibacillus sp. LR5S19]MDL4840638.1 DUF1294 domain-containing protein [Aquibacillus sp. LR5S19]
MEILSFTLIYLFTMNLLAYILMGIDKKRSKNNEWRISEKTLWSVSVIGGAIGTLVAMKYFRHKTKHASFKYGIPLICVTHIVIFFYSVI